MMAAFLAGATGCCLWRKKQKEEDRDWEGRFSVFDFNTLRNATNDFSSENKLGQGSTGSVYKGTLSNGKEIAVKRFSRDSMKGLPELKNEVDLLGHLQHKNLIRFLGYCLEHEEKLLCHEFQSNGSLDRILSSKEAAKRAELDWEKRFKIIKGICRGLLYLHEELPITIIHRDLKPRSILLDNDMTPKISDFTIARVIPAGQTDIETTVQGTCGYLAPECFKRGSFSVKSDVFSLGAVILEIVTGRRIVAHADGSGEPLYLVPSVWKHYLSAEVIEVVDPALGDDNLEQMTKCIHIALLCLQENPELRPTMEVVNMMLNRDSAMPAPLPPPLPVWGGSFDDEHASDTDDADV